MNDLRSIFTTYLETSQDDDATRMKKMNECLARYPDKAEPAAEPVPEGAIKCLGVWSGDSGELLTILQTCSNSRLTSQTRCEDGYDDLNLDNFRLSSKIKYMFEAISKLLSVLATFYMI